MSLQTAVLSFAALAGLMTIVPDLDTAIVLRSAIVHGRRAGFATARGVSSGALLARRGTRRATDGLTGAVLVGFGLKLGLSSR